MKIELLGFERRQGSLPKKGFGELDYLEGAKDARRAAWRRRDTAFDGGNKAEA
jgi:hypothetical protein